MVIVDDNNVDDNVQQTYLSLSFHFIIFRLQFFKFGSCSMQRKKVELIIY